MSRAHAIDASSGRVTIRTPRRAQHEYYKREEREAAQCLADLDEEDDGHGRFWEGRLRCCCGSAHPDAALAAVRQKLCTDEIYLPLARIDMYAVYAAVANELAACLLVCYRPLGHYFSRVVLSPLLVL